MTVHPLFLWFLLAGLALPVMAADKLTPEELRGSQLQEPDVMDIAEPGREPLAQQSKQEQLRRIRRELMEQPQQPEDFSTLDPTRGDPGEGPSAAPIPSSQVQAPVRLRPDNERDPIDEALAERARRPELLAGAHLPDDSDPILDNVNIWDAPPERDLSPVYKGDPTPQPAPQPPTMDTIAASEEGTDAEWVGSQELPPTDQEGHDEPSHEPDLEGQGLRFMPFWEGEFGYTTNAASKPDGRHSVFARSTVGFGLRSNGERHAFNADVDVGRLHYFSQNEASTTQVGVDLSGRLDFSQNTTTDFAASYAFEKERNSRFKLQPARMAKPSYVHKTSVEAALRHQFETGSVTLRGQIRVINYEDPDILIATVPGGPMGFTMVPVQFSRDSLDGSLALRLSLEHSDTFQPFVEVAIGRYILRGKSPDKSSNATLYAGRVGARFNLASSLRGEARFGYEPLVFSTPGVPRAEAYAGALHMTWTPSDLTTLDLGIASRFVPSTQTGIFGVTQYRMGLSLNQMLRRALALELDATYDIDFERIATSPAFTGGVAIPQRRTLRTFTVNTGIVYQPDPRIEVKPEYTYEHVHSSFAGESHKEHRIGLRVRLQP